MSSVQFRSRIKPAFDYSDKLNSYGVCCGQTGDNIKTIKSFTECFNEGGHFIPVVDGNPDSVICPNSDIRLGCCCACSYVTPGQLNQIPTLNQNGDVVSVSTPYLSSGFRNNISRCECERIRGKWTETECSSLNDTINDPNYWKTRCLIGVTNDARAPRSCCHLNFNADGIPTGIECEDVCTIQECGVLGTDQYPSIFGSDRCFVPLIEGTSIPPTTCASGVPLSLLSTKTTAYQGFEIGSCFTLEEGETGLEYNCSLSPEFLCEGYWTPQAEEENAFCDISYAPENPQKINGKYQPQTMSLSNFGLLGLTSGDEYQGGIYIGVFQTPNDNTTSTVYGSINFGTPSFSKYRADSVGSSYTKWAIIVDETPYNISFLLPEERDINYTTSLWDGYYNTYGDNNYFNGIETALSNTIRYRNRKGFIDYYLPSIYEIQFYSAYLKTKNIKDKGILLSSSIFNTKYISKTDSNFIGDQSFAYGQVIQSTEQENYKTVLVNKRVSQTVFFFRKIILT